LTSIYKVENTAGSGIENEKVGADQLSERFAMALVLPTQRSSRILQYY